MIRKVGRYCRKCYIDRVKSLVGEKGVIIIFGEGVFCAPNNDFTVSTTRNRGC